MSSGRRWQRSKDRRRKKTGKKRTARRRNSAHGTMALQRSHWLLSLSMTVRGNELRRRRRRLGLRCRQLIRSTYDAGLPRQNVKWDNKQRKTWKSYQWKIGLTASAANRCKFGVDLGRVKRWRAAGAADADSTPRGADWPIMSWRVAGEPHLSDSPPTQSVRHDRSRCQLPDCFGKPQIILHHNARQQRLFSPLYGWRLSRCARKAATEVAVEGKWALIFRHSTANPTYTGPIGHHHYRPSII